MDAFPSRGKIVQPTADYKPITHRLLTIHDHPHTLDETVNDLKSLGCGSQSLVACELVQPLQDCLDVLLSENFLCKFDCVALSKVTSQEV